MVSPAHAIDRQDFEVEIKPMPGCLRHSLPHMLKEVEEAWKYGVRTFVVFPKVRGICVCVFFPLLGAAGCLLATAGLLKKRQLESYLSAGLRFPRC